MAIWRTEPLDLFLYFTYMVFERIANAGVVRGTLRDVHQGKYGVDKTLKRT